VRADGVTHEAISRRVWQQTRQQVEQEPGAMLLVHDDTEVDYGYGPAISGFFVHTVLAVVPRGTSERVLGLLHQEAWVRQPAPRQADGSKQSPRQRRERARESEVWRRAVALVGSPPEGQVWIHVADRYASRWPIEDFHRGVKTGCRLEQRHLQEQRSLENLLAIVSPIAVRLLQLRNLCREEPEQPATKWVEPEEAQVSASQQGEALEQLTIEQFVSSVAQLGGFLRRASDGPPGWQTLWDGWLRLRWFVAGIRFATNAPVDASARSPCMNG
jgi:hypothetical protein